jgi:hypothetical protein
MKAYTHYLFSLGASLALLSLFRQLDLGATVMVLWLSLSINFLVDVLGHASRDGNPTRTWITHSVLTAPVWGALIAWVSLAAIWQSSATAPPRNEVGLWAAMGALISCEHLFLDSLTQAGIYSFRRRIALAHFRFDNVALNLGFALLGAILTAVSLGLLPR